MILKEVIRKLNMFAPPTIASFDHVGFIVPVPRKNVKKIGITLDASLQTIAAAGRLGCDLLITHHGPNDAQFSLDSALDQKRISLAKELVLPIYRMHLNLDFCKDGTSETLCKLLGFPFFYPAPTRYKNHRLKTGAHIAKGDFSLENLLDRVRKLNPSSIRLIPSSKKLFQKVAIAPGEGFQPAFLEQLPGIDAFISGELNHIAIIRARDLDICLIEATHASTENEPLKEIAKRLETFMKIPIIFLESNDALQVIPVEK